MAGWTCVDRKTIIWDGDIKADNFFGLNQIYAYDSVSSVDYYMRGGTFYFTDFAGNLQAQITSSAEDALECTAKFYTLGIQNDAQDVVISFTALGADGLLTWDVSADLFLFNDDIMLADGEQLYFGDTSNFIREASNTITINGATRTTLAAGGTNGVQVTATTVAVSLPLNVTNTIQCDGIVNDTGLAHGTYTPTLTNVANLAASTAYQCQYMRVGDTVTVSGKVDVDPTVTATATQLGISLPVTSNFGAAEDCGGVAFASGVAGQGAAILGDATNNRAEMNWVATDVTNQPMYFTFTYQVI